MGGGRPGCARAGAAGRVHGPHPHGGPGRRRSECSHSANPFPIATRTQSHTVNAGRSHSFASNVMDAGGALDEAQELLGHARAGSTQIYLHQPRRDCATPLIASRRARRRAATAGERGVGSGQRLSTGACDRGPLVATGRGVSHHRRVEPGNRNTCTTTRSPAVGVSVLPCSGMPKRSGACGRVLRDLPEDLPTFWDVGRGVRDRGAGAPASAG